MKKKSGVDRSHLQPFSADKPRTESKDRICARARAVTQAVTKSPIRNSTLKKEIFYIQQGLEWLCHSPLFRLNILRFNDLFGTIMNKLIIVSGII